MVVVDLKTQEAVQPKRLLFYSGATMQAAAVENKGVWSHPPYGGWQVNGDKTLKERSFNEGRYLPVPDPEPEYSVRSGFTEPVITRRLMVVTDDFVANFDYGKGEVEHTFDCLYHLQGFGTVQDLEEQELQEYSHTEQLDVSPLGSAQFITDCGWYRLENGGKLNFHTTYDEAHNNGNQWISNHLCIFINRINISLLLIRGNTTHSRYFLCNLKTESTIPTAYFTSSTVLSLTSF